MAGAQCVLVMALFFGLAHSWDFAVSAGDRIEFYNNDGNKTDTVRFMTQNVSALAYDEAHNVLLYVDKQSDNDAICGYNMTSLEYKCYVQRNGRNIQGLAFDPITEVLFFTDTKERSINYFSFKSGSKNNDFGNLLLKMDTEEPTDIAVDHCRGYIYWINDDIISYTIERARFDGSNREVVISFPFILDLHSLAIDQQTYKIYWFMSETSLNRQISTADLDGNNLKTLIRVNHNEDIAFVAHPNTLTISKNLIFLVSTCSNCETNSVWKLQMPEIQRANYNPLTSIPTKSALSIAANYKMKDQFQGLSDCIQVPNNYEIDDSKVAREYYAGPLCIHVTKVDEHSACKCTAGYTGVRCEVSVCENYCFGGNCSLTEKGLPECRCETGYYGTRCEINACFQYCLNNGTCYLNEADDPVCECLKEYEGKRCDILLRENNGDYSHKEENESACQNGSHKDSLRDNDEIKSVTTSSQYFLVDKNITLAALLESWSKQAQTLP